MRRIEIDYQNTENLINNLKLILDGIEDEQRSIKKSLNELYDLENYYVNRNQIIEELEFRERQIYKDIQSTEELIINIDSFSKSVQETDERLAHKFKQDIKSYAKENSIEIASEFDKWLNRIQIGLDVWGTLSPGPIADGLNGIIYFLQGDIKNGLTSLAGMIPYIGDSVKGVRYLDNASDLLKLGDKVVDLKQSSKKISKATDKLNLDDIDFNIFNGKGNSNITSNIAEDISKSKKVPKRPSWRKSELDVQLEFPEHAPQKSFIDGKEVPYGTKGSSRPDFYKKGSSIEVKNYKVTTPEGRSRLIRNVTNQINKRINDLPEKTGQTIIIDVRGQNVSNDVLRGIRDKILEKSEVDVNIQFKR